MIPQRRFLIERSPTPIYDRIVGAINNSLLRLGHRVTLVEPGKFSDHPAYVEFINNADADYCLISNTGTRLSAFLPKVGKYLFELVDVPMIFLHHDNVVSQQGRPDAIGRKFAGLRRIREKSAHYCIEPYFCADIESFGSMDACYISHASEFARIHRDDEKYKYDLSFVGHILPTDNSEIGSQPWPTIVDESYRKRLTYLDSKIEPDANRFASSAYDGEVGDLEWISAKYYYIWTLNWTTPWFRGDVISRMEDFDLHVFGGDPGYLNRASTTRRISKPGLSYHPPTANYRETSDIYASSRINLNFSALQFDDAVVNRVIDIGAAGGFVLTDNRSHLQRLTSVHAEISYSTVEELNSKIRYYLDHEKERVEIAEKLHKDIVENCSYERVLSQILSGT